MSMWFTEETSSSYHFLVMERGRESVLVPLEMADQPGVKKGREREARVLVDCEGGSKEERIKIFLLPVAPE